MKTLNQNPKSLNNFTRKGADNRVRMVSIAVKFLSFQFQGEKAHSNPTWDSQPVENGYQNWSVHGVKAVKTTSPKVVNTASSVEPINVSESVVRIVVTPKTRAIRLKRGERNMLRSQGNGVPQSIFKSGQSRQRDRPMEPIALPANRQVSKPQKNGQWERVKPILSLDACRFSSS